MKTEIIDYKRHRLFNIYDSRTNPFLMFNTKLDVTNIINYCKIHKNYYATIGFILLKTINDFDCFKYRKQDGKIYKYDYVKANFTDLYGEDELGFFACDGKNYQEFLNNFKIQRQKMKDGIKEQENDNTNLNGDEVWFSCEPWFEYTSLVTPFDKTVTIPQFNWCKFYEEDDKVYTSLMIMIHHGFADGKHMGEFLDKLKYNINNFEEIIK